MALNTCVNDILWNLDILGNIEIHKTLLVVGDRLFIDDRYFQYIQRKITGDGREQTLQVIEKTFKLLEEILQAYQCNQFLNPKIQHFHTEQIEMIENMIENLSSLIKRNDVVQKGLNTLSTFERYNNDASFKIKMNRFIEQFIKLNKKSEDLKEKMQSRLLQHPFNRKISINPKLECCFQLDCKSDNMSINSDHSHYSPDEDISDDNQTHSISSIDSGYDDSKQNSPTLSPLLSSPETEALQKKKKNANKKKTIEKNIDNNNNNNNNNNDNDNLP